MARASTSVVDSVHSSQESTKDRPAVNLPRLAAQANSTTTTTISKLQEGKTITLNGQTFPVAWSQWQEGDTVLTGISDTSAMEVLGLELLSTSNFSVQPVNWFSSEPQQPLVLKARFFSPYRYLDLRQLAALAGWQMQIVGDTLAINSAPAQILNVRQGNQPWGKRIVVDLDRPAFWRVSQNPQEGVVMIDSTVLPTLLEQFQPPATADETLTTEQLERDDLPEIVNSEFFLSLEKAEKETKLKVNLPKGKQLRVFSLPNPHRLVIDVRPQALVERQIAWTPGVRWHQQYISINSTSSSEAKAFPVVWLEIDPRSTNIALQPITSDSSTMTGIAPLVNTARSLGASIAVNGGFFNRDNQLPLGAIRTDNAWLSGPILNRAAIAWNDQGDVKIGNLRLEEILTTSSGERLPVLFLNSGYVKPGLARYTRDWGATYTPLTDNETIILVENEQIKQQFSAGLAGEKAYSIPDHGYLLTVRVDQEPLSAFKLNTKVKLETKTAAAEFAHYPHIVGAGPLLLQNRQIVLDAIAEQFSTAFEQQAASRSAIGTTNRGTLIIAAVHRDAQGSGSTLEELAQIMQGLGAVDALNLDGGSSTALYLGGHLIDRSAVTAARVHNGIGIFIK